MNQASKYSFYVILSAAVSSANIVKNAVFFCGKQNLVQNRSLSIWVYICYSPLFRNRYTD